MNTRLASFPLRGRGKMYLSCVCTFAGRKTSELLTVYEIHVEEVEITQCLLRNYFPKTKTFYRGMQPQFIILT